MAIEAGPRNWSPRRSLRIKVTLGVVLPLFLVLSIFTAIEYVRHRKAVLDNLSLLASHSGQVIKNNLRLAMLESNFAEVQILLDAIGETEDFRVVYLLDKKGEVIFSPNRENVGARLNNRLPGCQPCHRLPAGDRPVSLVITGDDNQRVFRSMHSIENSPECAQCHPPEERLIGLLLTDIPTAPMDLALRSNLRENLLWGASTILVTIVIVNLTLNQLVLKQLEGIAQALARFGRDELNFRLPQRDPDEIGLLVNAFNDMGSRLEAEAAENQTLSKNLQRQSEQRGVLLNQLITAQEDERKRVARELHDDLGQALSGLAFHAEVMEGYIPSDPKRAIEQLSKFRELIDETMNGMYDLILALRPSALDDLGLIAALKTHFDRFLTGTGITYNMEVGDFNGRLSPQIETCLYRTFQEALNNVVRHAEAKHVFVSLANCNGAFQGVILDDGIGFDPHILQGTIDGPRGLGLLGMKERITQCGGQLEIQSRPGSGTRLNIYIPLSEVSSG